MQDRKTKRLLWIIGFLVLLIVTVSVAYVLGIQQRDKKMAQATEPAKSKTTTAQTTASPKTNGHQATSQPKTTSKSDNKSTDNVIPSQFEGTWYDGNQKYAVISGNEFILPSNGLAITKTSSPLQLCDESQSNGTYYLYHNLNKQGIDPVYWIGNLTIDGKNEKVLACYTRMGWFAIYTSHPTNKKQGIQYDDTDWEDKIGTTNLDSLRGKTRADLANND